MLEKILIVDDEPLIVKILSSALQAKGYEVATAENGIEALTVVNTHKPDLVISDVGMPGMDGFELVQSIRLRVPNANFILMSGGTDFDDVRNHSHIEQLNLVAAFKKPFSVADFFAAIDQALKGSKASGE